MPDPALRGKVLLPILGDQYGIVLERGELRLGFDAERGAFAIDYFEHRLPLDPKPFGPLLMRAMRLLPGDDAQHKALQSLASALSRLPPHDTPSAAARERRRSALPGLRWRLAELASRSAAMRECIESLCVELNGQVGQRESFDALDTLIDAQPYRLAHWRVAGDEINYRRFFDVNGLAALRQEREPVFEATHGLILQVGGRGRHRRPAHRPPGRAGRSGGLFPPPAVPLRAAVRRRRAGPHRCRRPRGLAAVCRCREDPRAT